LFAELSKVKMMEALVLKGKKEGARTKNNSHSKVGGRE
jgi:hypothetical protein